MPSIFVRVWRLFYKTPKTVCLSLCVCRSHCVLFYRVSKKSEFYRIEQGETAQENKGNILEKNLRAEEGGTS